WLCVAGTCTSTELERSHPLELSAFTGVHSPSKTGVYALWDSLWARGAIENSGTASRAFAPRGLCASVVGKVAQPLRASRFSGACEPRFRGEKVCSPNDCPGCSADTRASQNLSMLGWEGTHRVACASRVPTTRRL